jgi:hypothetical protein
VLSEKIISEDLKDGGSLLVNFCFLLDKVLGKSILKDIIFPESRNKGNSTNMFYFS